MKLPNGYGSITKLSGHRRKPFWVRTACVYDSDGNAIKESRITLGYYATKREAISALEEYNKNPYDLKNKGLTLKEVFDKWKSDCNLAQSTLSSYTQRFNCIKSLWDIEMRAISFGSYQEIVDKLSPSNAKVVKNMLSSVYKYAMKYEIVDKDISQYLTAKPIEKSDMHKPYTTEEINELWRSGTDSAKAQLLLIYTGWRASELLECEIDYENQIMKGGKKTTAGKNRIVPIHHRILPIVKELDGTVIGCGMPYGVFYHRYFGDSNHSSHDCRHTIITILQSKGAPERLIKKLVGHTNDVTNDVYTHTSVEELRKIVEMLD